MTKQKDREIEMANRERERENDSDKSRHEIKRQKTLRPRIKNRQTNK